MNVERLLRDAQAEWPPTPDLAPRVEARAGATARRTPWLLQPGWAVALALIVAAGVAMAVPPARSAILKALGVGGAEIRRVPQAPRATPVPLGTGLDLGEPTTAERVRRQAGFTPAPPTALGRPDAIWFADSPPIGGRVSYLYGHRILVQEMRAQVSPFIEKAAGPHTKIERLRNGFYLSGAPHGFAYASGGSVAFEDQRLAGPTLLIERGGLLLRVEGRIPKRRALRIAASIHARVG